MIEFCLFLFARYIGKLCCLKIYFEKRRQKSEDNERWRPLQIGEAPTLVHLSPVRTDGQPCVALMQDVLEQRGEAFGQQQSFDVGRRVVPKRRFGEGDEHVPAAARRNRDDATRADEHGRFRCIGFD